MHLCYIDESGTSDLPGNTSHFVLAGISLPIWHWRDADDEISTALKQYGLAGEELHTAWMLRPYLEQSRIKDFDKLNRAERRAAVERYRKRELLRLQKAHNKKTYRQTKKNYQKTSVYVHLTMDERRALVRQIADHVSDWGFARLFAECIDKIHFDPVKNSRSVDEQAFEQLVSRFEQYLQKTDASIQGQKYFGLLVHDNNETVAKKHTELMRRFHNQGTLWTQIKRIIETPLFVDSRLTSMVQIADLCAYALRRYLENGETDLFHRVFSRADRFQNRVVGIRHFTDHSCSCDICKVHR